MERFSAIGFAGRELMDDRAAQLTTRPAPAGNDYRERVRRHRARDRITNRNNASQYSTKLRGTLDKSFHLILNERDRRAGKQWISKKGCRFYMVVR